VRATRASAPCRINGVLVLAEIGSATSLFQTLATSTLAGTAVAGFLAAARVVLGGRRRGEFEVDALMSTFWGSLLGCFCLLYDLALR
jgi:hypothetical protein